MCSHGCTCVHMLLLTCKHITSWVYVTMQTNSLFGLILQKVSPFPTEKRDVVYILYGMLAGSKANQQIQRMVACTSDKETCGGLFVSASSWQDAPTGPPETIIGKFVERTKAAFVTLPIPVNDGCSLSSSGCTDWKKRYARQYN